MLFSLRDKMHDEIGDLVKGFMTIEEYEAYFHSMSRCAIASISIEMDRIKNFIKGLYTSLQLAMAQLETKGGSF